jgi:hypothetical protein
MLDKEIEIKEKQDYLRENILEKGYNVDEFMQYLKVLKGENGLKVENWSKNDLVKAVHDFKRVNPPEQFKIKSNQLNNKYPGEEEKENDIVQNNENENNINNNNNNNNNRNSNNQMQAKELLQCKISEKNEISNIFNLTITISSPKATEGSLFSKSYVTYLIETKPLGLQVRRRFSDFVWLHDLLKVLYINCIIPPIIKKNYFSGITDIQIQKRMRLMEKFLQELINHPILRNSQIVYDFISIRDDKDYNLKKNAYSKMVLPAKAEDIKTLNGEIDISINKEKELLVEQIKRIAENNEDLMGKITKEYKILNLQIQSVISKITDINILWDQLYKKSTQNYEGEIILGAYDSLAKFMEDWAKMQKTQIDLINTKLREYFRYIKYEYHSIKEFHKMYEDKKYDYQKSYQKLSDTKEKLFSEKKVNNWGMDREDLDNKVLLFKEKELSMEKMLPEETKKVKDKKKLYGSYLNSLIEEYGRITNLNSQRHKENIVGFIRDMSNTMITFHVSLNQMNAYLDSLKEDMFAGEGK